MTRVIPDGVGVWHRYVDRHHPQEMNCDTCGRAKRDDESPADGWWKRFRAKLNRTERKCPDCKRARRRAPMRARDEEGGMISANLTKALGLMHRYACQCGGGPDARDRLCEELRANTRASVADETEACARIADQYALASSHMNTQWDHGQMGVEAATECAANIATHIRQRASVASSKQEDA